MNNGKNGQSYIMKNFITYIFTLVLLIHIQLHQGGYNVMKL